MPNKSNSNVNIKVNSKIAKKTGNKNKIQKKHNKKSSNKNTGHKKSQTNTRKKGQTGGGDSEICNRDINELLTTNKKIYTYEKSGRDGKSLSQSASILANKSGSGWGSNPGPPPDPSGCTIL